MDENMTLPDIVARLNEQKNRRKAQRDAEPGGMAIARQRAARAAGIGPHAMIERQFWLSPPAYQGLIRLAAKANYVASADTGRAKGLSEFVCALFNPTTPAPMRITFTDTRPPDLIDPDYLPGYASPERLNYKFWWTPRMDRESHYDRWRLQRHIRMPESVFANIVHVAIAHEIASPDRIHATWNAIVDYCAAYPQPDPEHPIHKHPYAANQASAVLEAIGIGHLTPSHLPHSDKLRRYRRKPLTDLDFF